MAVVQNSTLVTLPQLLDISLNFREGIINFQALHTLLNVVVSQTNLRDVAVEFRGYHSDRIQALITTAAAASQASSPSASFVEYTVTKPQKKKKGPPKKVSLQDIQEKMQDEEKKERELRVIEQRKDSKEDPDQNPLPLKSPTGSHLGVTPGDLHTVVLVDSQSNLPQFSVAVDKVSFDELQQEVLKLKEQMKELTELPGNADLIAAVRTESGPIVDMFQILTLTKRIDAAETGIEKMGSLIEDAIKKFASSEGEGEDRRSKGEEDAGIEFREFTQPLGGELEQRVEGLEKAVEDLMKLGNLPVKKESEQTSKPEAARESTGVVDIREKTTEKVKVFNPTETYDSLVENVELSHLATNEAIALIQQEFNNMKNWISNNIVDFQQLGNMIPSSNVTADLGDVEMKYDQCMKKVDELTNIYTDQIKILREATENIKKEVTDVVVKIQGLPTQDSTGISEETTMDLANKLLLLEKEIISVTEKAKAMEEEKEQRDKHMEAIMEQIDILKIIKANREDLEDALGDKADACMINRKVSHDQFDAACDDLSRGIEEALSKLEEQQDMWRQALEAIQKDVGNKLDKNEVNPLRDFVNSKLKALQEKFKSLTSLRKEQEAAGTKSKVLRNVNCISCDKDVVMRKEMDVSLKPKPYAMPPNRSIAPYLAYELDQLRKQQKCVPNSKNLNFFESALKTSAAKDKDHLCNRYCGGSHTITTPQQRVTRLGHFLEQWGPEIAPLKDEYIKGSNNQMYRASNDKRMPKQGKQEPTQMKHSIKPNLEYSPAKVPASVSQQERNTFVSVQAQEAIMEQNEQPNNEETSPNIGKLSTTLQTSATESQERQTQQLEFRISTTVDVESALSREDEQ